ncbi:von Willebrand factor D and EGF domain-containing protein-like isoform X2 [Dendronephthya gigantea]|uniref:von Willebrand factor D and EGF domain-containing protein-like isoform X2 n=1 Tax=Dendronephthya gigantea TaxID=151771 RepID=UPI00106B51D3|nr:von Willebrand factor D and EGF domain-containing protein-like isoform X2 [Dendronephthya gigantea]
MKACTILFEFLVLLKIVNIDAQTCDQIKYTTINDIRRSTKFKVKPSSKICDRNFIKDDNWYRFDSVAGNTIPDHNPTRGFCGTFVPIWFKGTHPTQNNVVTNAKACAAVPFLRPEGCGISYNIKVIKCGSFFLYRLKEPQQCDFAYCAGTKLPNAPCSVTGETLPVCPGAIPRVVVGAGIKHEDTQEVRLKCFWESPGNLSNIEYEARWFGDISHPEPKIQRNFTGSEVPEFLFQPKITNDKNGYEFHKNVYCSVRARFKTGSWSKWVSSNRIYTGMEVTPTYIPINDCGESDREVIITIRPHLPIRVRPVKIDIASPTTKLIDEICVVGEKEGFQDCGIVFETGHRVGRPIRFKLMTNCGTGDKSKTLAATYKLQHSFFDFNINRFWVNHAFPTIKISRKKYKKQQCRSTGDPHFQTFDGRRYDFFGRGTFLLYGNKHYGTEIHVRQRACNGGTPSCNCGVAIRENLFYKIYDMCYVTPGRPWWENNVRSRLRTHQLRDFKLSRFYSAITQKGSTTKFEITLPSGVKVIVDRQSWGLNIYVWAPADLEHPSEGLCGNNNENSNDDFGQWNSPNQFGEHWRVRSHLTQFDYKGNKFEEDQLDDGCDQKICVCSQGGIRRCGREAEAICFPDLGGKDARRHHQGSGIGECPNRPKRALMLDDDTVDDQDAIPSFNPTVTRVNLTLTWPTPSGITKDNVTQFCEKKLRYSKAGAACGQVEGVDVDGLVQQCITDIQATEDFSWAAGNFAALETSCIANIFNNISSFKNTTDGSIELDTDILTSLCPNDCSDKGDCVNSTCICHKDYTAADCSISLKDSPLVFDIRKSGLCDRRRRPCRTVGVFGFPLLDSEKLTCHVQEYKVIDSVWKPSNSRTLYPGQLVDLTEVKCSLPESPVNIGDYGNEGVAAAGLKIAISNNRINASKDSVLFITYDSVCQECNTTVGCHLRADACIISGHCFAMNDSNPRDWCQQCLPESSTTSWSKRKDNRPPILTSSSVFYAFKGKELRVQLSADDPENRTVQYSFAQGKTFGATLSKNGSFTWIKNDRGTTAFVFNVTDECGAYSTLNVSVVLKDCSCVNSGECHPDYRYLDGAGNFTCSCLAEYTGDLCEDDVDECAASNPCHNGSCVNEKPGFSCSCFQGYTSHLCQTEINECASNPCFLGVTCTDRVAGFSCGPCPPGYTGDAKYNCSRVDGKVDECIENPKVCHNASCKFYNGSYQCRCIDGYTGDGENCTDVDECMGHPCLKHATCINTKGSYFCVCAKGFTGDGGNNCSDINECAHTPDVCNPQANCRNTPGSFFCHCKTGFTGNGANCTDIDECAQSPCHEHARCNNTMPGYVCECRQGYLGDGKNCTENKPPQFSTPNMLLGIYEESLRVQIKAEDPEDQKITFTLLENGTISLSSASITKDGRMDISLSGKNGTVYVQVEDVLGGRNVLILHVNAMQCPCEHGGKCYQKKSVKYPTTPSDYLCECKAPFSGNFCEIRPNPCDERPCYLGLTCSLAQNSEGFTCETCPPLFKGDGKTCELDTTKEKNSVDSSIKLTNQQWNEKLAKKTSKEYKNLVSRLIEEIRDIYKQLPGFSFVMVKELRQGSVIVDFQIIFTKKVDNPLEPLEKVAKAGKLGNMTFEIQRLDDTDDSSTEDRILGLDKTIFIVIVVAIVVLILIIIVAICLRRRRERNSGAATLNKYQTNMTYTISNQAGEGAMVLNLEEMEKQKEDDDDEIDLEVFHNDKVCTKEQIKLT